MLSDQQLLVAIRALEVRQLVVCALLHHTPQPARTPQLTERGLAIGFRRIKDWNVSDVLAKAEAAGLVARMPDGWRLLPDGVQRLRDAGLDLNSAAIAETRHALRAHLATVKDEDRHRFLEEAIGCFEAGNCRAAIVLSWVGAVHILQCHIVAKHLPAYNTAGVKRFGPEFKVRSLKDFAVLQESDFLQLCQDAGVLDKAEKMELQARLDLRNRCGHPNAVKVAEHTVASHLELLMLNVYSRY